MTVLLASFLGGIVSVYTYRYFEAPEASEGRAAKDIFAPPASGSVLNVSSPSNPSPESTLPDFAFASEKSVHAVVHIKNISKGRTISFYDLFAGRIQEYTPEMMNSGSGVIISEDGYIVTNNHVVENNAKLEVTLNNNKTYEATLVGADPETDIALIKINDKNLPYLTFADSDAIVVGQWVLAVGNPFSFNSTVTAGIISAKARDIDLDDNKDQSFIQTDAAVNPGNSGGALVDTSGNLVGINTAIFSNTRAYIGFSFAIPSNVAKRLVQDIIEYGRVQKVVLGIRGITLDSKLAQEKNLDQTEGVYVDEVFKDSGAEKGGLRKGDVITQIDDIKINKYADFSGYVTSKRLNDALKITIIRDKKEKTLSVKILKDNAVNIPSLGISVKELTKEQLSEYKTNYGVLVYEAGDSSDIAGKVIIKVNDIPIRSPKELQSALEKAASRFGRVYITFLNREGGKEIMVLR